MGADLPNVRGGFRLALDRAANGTEMKARISAVSDRRGTGRVPLEALLLRFADVPGPMREYGPPRHKHGRLNAHTRDFCVTPGFFGGENAF